MEYWEWWYPVRTIFFGDGDGHVGRVCTGRGMRDGVDLCRCLVVPRDTLRTLLRHSCGFCTAVLTATIATPLVLEPPPCSGSAYVHGGH